MDELFETYGQGILAALGLIAIMTISVYFIFDGPLSVYLKDGLSTMLP